MDLAQGLLLNEDALKTLADNKKEAFIYEWLQFLQKVLKASQKNDIKEKQEKLVDQLTSQIEKGCGPPTRALIGHCLSSLYKVGDSFTIYKTVSKCNDIVKSKDDSPSYLQTRLAAIVTIGILYESQGRLLGGLFPDTVQVLLKGLKNGESQTRSETMLALRRILAGLGCSAAMSHRDIYKAAKSCLLDRSMIVRTSAAQCLKELIGEAGFVYGSEMELLVQHCVRALDDASYDTRSAIAQLLGTLVANTHKSTLVVTKGKKTTVKEGLEALESGFVHAGATGGARDLLKGSSITSLRSIRVGVTEAYVEFAHAIGADWIAPNLPIFIPKLLNILSHPKSTPNHIESVYSQRCVSYILRSTLGTRLVESQQQSAILELCKQVTRHLSMLDAFAGETGTSSGGGSGGGGESAHHNQYILVSCLQEIGSLFRSLGASALPLFNPDSQNVILDPVMGALVYPSLSTRLSAAWCLRCIASAFPSQTAVLIERCVQKVKAYKSSDEALSGYTAAISALIGSVQDSSDSISFVKTKTIFGLADEILRKSGESARLSVFRAQGAWLLFGALMTLGSSAIKPHVNKMLVIWKATFPRSPRELEGEKKRGDAFSWQVTLESRSGALCAMRSFVAHCGDLLEEDEEITRRLMIPLESAMALIPTLPEVISRHGSHLKAAAAMLRLRLYDILALLPPSVYEGSFSSLLRELVAEFTLTDNPANTTTSMLRSLCHHDDCVLLGSWLKESDQSVVEEQLSGHSASGSGALEHDPTSVYLALPPSKVAPGALPLGVSVIDGSIALFGIAFPRVAMKHRLQMLRHFDTCAKQAQRNPQRQRAIRINVFTALICALKGLGECKKRIGGSEVRQAATQLIVTALGSSDVTLRCAAGEAIGRMAQVTDDQQFVAQTIHNCFEKLKTARDVISRTGHSLALGCLHRYVGGIGSSQHLRMSVGILLALSQDSNSPEVQVWALHALSLIVDAFGPMFRSYVDATLHVLLSLLLQVASYHTQVHRSLARCLGALITTLGPELQGSGCSVARSICLTSCAIMSHHTDAQVQAESVSCLQQLHMFAPRHVELASLVPRLCRYVTSWHLVLRRAALSCLRQFAQKEAREICHIVTASTTTTAANKDQDDFIGHTGLEGALLHMLDVETDERLVSDVRDTFSHLVQATAVDKLHFWLALSKSVLSAASDSAVNGGDCEEGGGGGGEDVESFTSTVNNRQAGGSKSKKKLVAARWSTKVLVINTVRKIITMCRDADDADGTHFDLARARRLVRSGQKGDYLVMHLSDLVRMSFMAATDNNTHLRMAGLEALQAVIDNFKHVPEPEFQGSLLLDQYQANVGAALRPAFDDLSPEVMVRACGVCSSWITSGVVSDMSDLTRVTSLLLAALRKVEVTATTEERKEGESNETSSGGGGGKKELSTLEKLAVLKAWAEIYIEANRIRKGDKHDVGNKGGGIMSLVQAHLFTLACCWFDVIKDHATLKLPPQLLPQQGGRFFTAESACSARAHLSYAWASVVHAHALHLTNHRFQQSSSDEDENDRHLHLVMGSCVEALCSPRISHSSHVIISCLSSIDTLLRSSWVRTRLASNNVVKVELLNVLHRLLLTRDSCESQKIVLNIVTNILLSSHECEKCEGGESGEIERSTSVVFALLEVCVCVLVRSMPSINPEFRAETKQSGMMKQSGNSGNGDSEVITIALKILPQIITLCSPRGGLTVLPTILYLLVGSLRVAMTTEARSLDAHSCVQVSTAALQALKQVMTSHQRGKDEEEGETPPYANERRVLIQSALATLLHFVKNDELERYNQVTVLTSLSLFTITRPDCLVTSPQLFVELLDHFQRCFTSSDPQLQMKTLTLVTPIIRHRDQQLACPAIHRMAPLVVKLVDGGGADRGVVGECLNLVQLLVSLARHNTRHEMLEMLVLLLVSCLRDDDDDDHHGNRNDEEKQMLHEDAIKRLLTIAPTAQQEFRTIMMNNPECKRKMEAALRESQKKKQEEQERSKLLRARSTTGAASTSTAHHHHQPAIKLKMDFSNFAASKK